MSIRVREEWFSTSTPMANNVSHHVHFYEQAFLQASSAAFRDGMYSFVFPYDLFGNLCRSLLSKYYHKLLIKFCGKWPRMCSMAVLSFLLQT